ncbi:MAG: hypothetical protein M1834_004894 [Cirrosporium novae-zelandiae]|nr:MAG: hypothetical protein M1834_004894 [Cirrosporium novae-zelandiae]
MLDNSLKRRLRKFTEGPGRYLWLLLGRSTTYAAQERVEHSPCSLPSSIGPRSQAFSKDDTEHVWTRYSTMKGHHPSATMSCLSSSLESGIHTIDQESPYCRMWGGKANFALTSASPIMAMRQTVA